MGDVFGLEYEALSADPRFSTLAQALGAHTEIDSASAFNHFCRDACRLWNEQFGEGIGETSMEFADLLTRIMRGGDDVIVTSWGGVVITLHEHPHVEKYLVIRRGGYLALEKHALKDEYLEVREGAGVILWRRDANATLTVQALLPSERFHFEPGREHCLIGTENLLVFERSIDPKGMDQDLIFLYEPD